MDAPNRAAGNLIEKAGGDQRDDTSRVAEGRPFLSLNDRQAQSLAARFPVGAKYILERHGRYVRRYIEYPDGRRIQLSTRRALTCTCLESQQIGVVPDPD